MIRALHPEKPKLVVIGNGMAGARLVEDVLALAPDTFDVTVFGDEPYGNYNRILLSNVLNGSQAERDIFMNPLAWYRDNGIRLHAGVKVARMRYAGVLLSGALAGIGGAYLSIGQSSLFTRNMTSGRGFIALAALIFGKWRPVQTLLACLLFGLTEAISIQMQGVVKLPSGDDIPVQFIQMVPYVLTIVVLAGFIGSSRPPRALGIPYEKER